MAPQAGTTNTRDLTPDPARYQVDDLIIDLAPRRVRRAETVIPLKALSFDLLVALVRAAPNLLSFDQLSERVWPGLVVTPETIVQRVKLLRSALGDDPHAPRYIEGVRGRGYRMVAEVRRLTERQGTPESIVPPSLKERKEEESPNVHAGIAATETAIVSSPSATPPAPPRPARWGPLGWIGGPLIMMALLAASWAIVYYRGASKPAERTSVVVSPVIHSLAVLPLDNLSGDQAQEYFADGMTDELITELGKIGALRVISRTSVMQYKGTRTPLSDIAHKLNVEAVLEGTVLRSGNRVRITAQLVGTAPEKHLWAESYERDLTDILTLQRNVARDVAREIRVKLSPREQLTLGAARPVNPEAHIAYLKGLFFLNKLSPDDLHRSVEFFDQAIALDPTYAQAYEGLSVTHTYLGIFGLIPSREAFPAAKTAALKALELDSTLADAYAVLGQVSKQYERDWAEAERMYRLALDLNPAGWLARGWYAGLLSSTGRFDEAIKLDTQARALDPISVNSGTFLGRDLYRARRYDEAIKACQEALELDPRHVVALWFLAQSLEQKHQFPEAIARLQTATSLSDGPPYRAHLANAYALTGNRAKALKILEELTARSNERYVVPLDIALIYTGLGDRDSAFQWLEKAYQERAARITELAEPHFDSLRSDPRFADLMRRIGLPL
jgi:TolB-like protein/DNA-binding winged helix-turn-helix (wHTH) protein/Tfp pilus assembly protein PilF